MTETPRDWPLRPWVLAGLLGLAGFLIWQLGGGEGPDTRIGWRAAVTAFLFFAPIVFAFALEPARWRAPLVFAVMVGAVMAGLAWRAVGQAETLAAPQYGFLAGLIATALALPLFQSDFQRLRWAIPYQRIHAAVWGDAIGAAGSLAFVGASWLMLTLLSELFGLLRITFLRELIRESWFGWTWSGAAFGAALGVLRNEAAIIGTLRRVVMTVLSILAVPLAAGLTLFLVAMLVSGPQVLWEATRSATPVLLTCAGGAWVLANAVLRDEDASMSGNRVLRGAGLALVLVVLPLTVFAAVSMGTRVAQHGLSPERIWGLIAIAVAVAYGLAWLVAVGRGWKGGEWREHVRRANLHLAVLVTGLALFLSLPIFDFGAISARHQLARLESGAVSAEEFDYDALRWDFGAAGRLALARLERGGDARIAPLARAARVQKERRYPSGPIEAYALRVQPADPALETLVRAYISANPWACQKNCVALDLGQRGGGGRQRVAIVTGSGYAEVLLPVDPTLSQDAAREEPAGPLLRPSSRVEVRDVTRRYIFVDGQPLERPLDDPAARAPSPLEAPPPPR